MLQPHRRVVRSIMMHVTTYQIVVCTKYPILHNTYVCGVYNKMLLYVLWRLIIRELADNISNSLTSHGIIRIVVVELPRRSWLRRHLSIVFHGIVIVAFLIVGAKRRNATCRFVSSLLLLILPPSIPSPSLLSNDVSWPAAAPSHRRIHRRWQHYGRMIYSYVDDDVIVYRNTDQ